MRTHITNLKEFDALIIRYENITLAEIIEGKCNTNFLTGFGWNATCTLCIGAGYIDNDKVECLHCVYSKTMKTFPKHGVPCNQNRNRSTYIAIHYAVTPEDLLKAYRNRAKHMREIREKYVIGIISDLKKNDSFIFNDIEYLVLRKYMNDDSPLKAKSSTGMYELFYNDELIITKL